MNTQTIVKTTINLGKVDYYGTGRKVNMGEVKLELKHITGNTHQRDIHLNPCPDYYVFTASGGIWDSRHYDYIHAGQMIDTLMELYPNHSQLQSIGKLWERWHLNDLKAGAGPQNHFIDTLKKAGWQYDYTDACTKLSQAGIYEVALDDFTYKYGTAWLVEPLPQEVIDQILSLAAPKPV